MMLSVNATSFCIRATGCTSAFIVTWSRTKVAPNLHREDTFMPRFLLDRRTRTIIISFAYGRKMDPICSARSVEVNQPPTSTLLLLIWLQFLWGHFFSIGFLTSDQNWSQLTPDTYMVIFWNKALWYRFGSALLLRQTIESHPCKQEIPGNS